MSLGDLRRNPSPKRPGTTEPRADLTSAWRAIEKRWDSLLRKNSVSKKDLLKLYEAEGEAERDLSETPLEHSPRTVQSFVDDVARRSLHGTVLDIGCGSNPVIDYELGKNGRRVIGLEISSNYAHLARVNARTRTDPPAIVIGDAESLPFKSHLANGVICIETLEHTLGPELAVSEIARVLKPGAILIATIPNRHRLTVLKQRFVDRLRGLQRSPRDYFLAASHVQEFTLRNVLRLLQSFRVLEVRSIPFPARASWERIQEVVLRFPVLRRLPLCFGIVAMTAEHQASRRLNSG